MNMDQGWCVIILLLIIALQQVVIMTRQKSDDGKLGKILYDPDKVDKISITPKASKVKEEDYKFVSFND